MPLLHSPDPYFEVILAGQHLIVKLFWHALVVMISFSPCKQNNSYFIFGDVREFNTLLENLFMNMALSFLTTYRSSGASFMLKLCFSNC